MKAINFLYFVGVTCESVLIELGVANPSSYLCFNEVKVLFDC